jgi:DNA-binding MarR family transcriptional regulator/N-acetylglutamate synthase-like GNAT family acetyltransferase
MADSIARRVAAIRRFNRFYTQRIGVLSEQLNRSPFSLTEARVLYEIAHREESTASEIGSDLGLDAGYLSRILSAFARKKLIRKKASSSDARKSLLRLTDRGQQAFARLNAESQHDISSLLSRVAVGDQRRLITAMRTIESALSAEPEHGAPFILRPPRAGDMGWVVERHGILYAEEYGWNEEFEALVAQIVADFIRNFDPKRERCWIAERRGENAGCVFLVKKRGKIAQLRLLLVEPSARGLGIGKRLVGECIRFSRRAGYRKMMLWTNDVLHAARHIYERNGFRLVEEKKHHSFGHDLVGQNWELRL